MGVAAGMLAIGGGVTAVVQGMNNAKDFAAILEQMKNALSDAGDNIETALQWLAELSPRLEEQGKRIGELHAGAVPVLFDNNMPNLTNAFRSLLSTNTSLHQCVISNWTLPPVDDLSMSTFSLESLKLSDMPLSGRKENNRKWLLKMNYSRRWERCKKNLATAIRAASKLVLEIAGQIVGLLMGGIPFGAPFLVRDLSVEFLHAVRAIGSVTDLVEEIIAFAEDTLQGQAEEEFESLVSKAARNIGVFDLHDRFVKRWKTLRTANNLQMSSDKWLQSFSFVSHLRPHADSANLTVSVLHAWEDHLNDLEMKIYSRLGDDGKRMWLPDVISHIEDTMAVYQEAKKQTSTMQSSFLTREYVLKVLSDSGVDIERRKAMLSLFQDVAEAAREVRNALPTNWTLTAVKASDLFDGDAVHLKKHVGLDRVLVFKMSDSSRLIIDARRLNDPLSAKHLRSILAPASSFEVVERTHGSALSWYRENYGLDLRLSLAFLYQRSAISSESNKDVTITLTERERFFLQKTSRDMWLQEWLQYVPALVALNEPLSAFRDKISNDLTVSIERFYGDYVWPHENAGSDASSNADLKELGVRIVTAFPSLRLSTWISLRTWGAFVVLQPPSSFWGTQFQILIDIHAKWGAEALVSYDNELKELRGEFSVHMKNIVTESAMLLSGGSAKMVARFRDPDLDVRILQILRRSISNPHLGLDEDTLYDSRKSAANILSEWRRHCEKKLSREAAASIYSPQATQLNAFHRAVAESKTTLTSCINNAMIFVLTFFAVPALSLTSSKSQAKVMLERALQYRRLCGLCSD